MSESLEPTEVIKRFKEIKQDYHVIINHYNECLMHAHGLFYPKVLTRRLNEDEATRQWRIDNFRPMTKDIWDRSLNQVGKIFDTTKFFKFCSDQLSEYLLTFRIDGMSIESWLEQRVLPLMMEDANGFIITILKYELLDQLQANPDDNETNDTDLQYQIMYDDSGKPVIDLKYVACDQVYYKDEKNLIYSPHSLQKKYNNFEGEKNGNGGMLEQIQTLLDGHSSEKVCYYWLNEYGYYKIELEKGEIELIPIYEVPFQRLPFHILGGNWRNRRLSKHMHGMYYSYFSNFLPWGDEALSSYSDYQALLAAHSYPIKVETQIECEVDGCNGGLIFNSLTNQHVNCPSCAGTGYKQAIGPFNVIVRPQAKNGTPTYEGPMIEYITPPLEPIDKLKESWELMLEKAERAIFLNTVEEAQSGIAKTIDRDSMVSFLKRIAQNLYVNIYQEILFDIEFYILGAITYQPVVVPPKEFLVYTEDELLTKIEETTIKPLKLDAYRELIDRKWSGQLSVQQMNRWNLIYNIIALDDDLTKMTKLQSGLISNEQYIMDMTYYQFFNQLILEYGEEAFNQTSLPELNQLLTEYVQSSISISTTGASSNADATGQANTTANTSY
jgi:hypothetical protein